MQNVIFGNYYNSNFIDNLQRADKGDQLIYKLIYARLYDSMNTSYQQE